MPEGRNELVSTSYCGHEVGHCNGWPQNHDGARQDSVDIGARRARVMDADGKRCCDRCAAPYVPGGISCWESELRMPSRRLRDDGVCRTVAPGNMRRTPARDPHLA